ncbi:hypothetical protein BJY01DRAFT_250919 [Aspergillus pseudoustus]|uniref:Uncharacterized protein n=1 Tax=Aspergillus pseudoustus TaxID=1810923 RepID=A0ABR4JFP9_9EURO
MDSNSSGADMEKVSCSSPQEYSSLMNEHETLYPHRRTRRCTRINLSRIGAGCIVLAVSLILIFCIYLLILLRNLPIDVERRINDYGYKGPIAIKYNETLGPYIECEESTYPDHPADCSFDLLANGWVPNLCFDAQMHHDAVDGRDYGFYLGRTGKRRLHQDVIMQGNISMYPTGLWHSWREHVDHCWYLLNGSVRATVAGSIGRLDYWIEDGHMQHCFHMLTKEKDNDPGFIDFHFKAVFFHHRCYLRHG